ncbi:MAG: hypothetical protein J6A50_06440 [Clostridia bacterium]|nr:hypothetical protein [Clostridia bacterium]
MNKQEANSKKKVCMVLICILCVIGIAVSILGITADCGGGYESNAYYGGDAYTGMQQASAQTANNVLAVGEIIETGLHFMGGVSVCAFAIILISTIAKIQELNIKEEDIPNAK